MIAWVPAILWMGCIFFLSHQLAQASSSLSGGVMDWIISFIPSTTSIHMDVLHIIIRKGAHFGAYFILAVFVIFALKQQVRNVRSYGIAFIICFLFAASDEFHQLFIPGRSGEIKDVLLDSSGSLLGLVGYGIISYWNRRRFQQRIRV